MINKKINYMPYILYLMVSTLELGLAIATIIINKRITINCLYMITIALLFLVLMTIELRNFKLSNNQKRNFEVVKDDKRKTYGKVILPTRGSTNAMAYDFYSNNNYTIKPGEITKIWTDVKAYMGYDEGLIINVRSSMGGKFMLANTSGWIDSDYYSNENNDGNIGIFLKNISNEIQTIKRGDRIAQGMFVKYLISDSGNTNETRKGGFGSTGE